ncbi:hypothetical protein CLU79DRAFT_733783, partial [Phycomyces nitens]
MHNYPCYTTIDQLFAIVPYYYYLYLHFYLCIILARIKWDVFFLGLCGAFSIGLLFRD